MENITGLLSQALKVQTNTCAEDEALDALEESGARVPDGPLPCYHSVVASQEMSFAYACGRACVCVCVCVVVAGRGGWRRLQPYF